MTMSNEYNSCRPSKLVVPNLGRDDVFVPLAGAGAGWYRRTGVPRRPREVVCLDAEGDRYIHVMWFRGRLAVNVTGFGKMTRVNGNDYATIPPEVFEYMLKK